MGCRDTNSSDSGNNESKANTETSSQNETGEQPEEAPINEDENTEASITDIRKNYQRISEGVEAGNYKIDSLTYDCESGPGGGELFRYYEAGELVLLKSAEGGEHSWQEVQVYFKTGEPFFVFEQGGSWQFGGPGDGDNPTTIDKFEERRYYIKDGKLIRQLAKNYEIKSWEKEVNSDEVPNQVVELKPGATYSGAADIQKIMVGDVGC